MKKVILLVFTMLLLQKTLVACNAFFRHSYSCAGDTVLFHALDQAGVYTWDFGDTTSGTANVSHDTDTYHIYINPGTYYVTLFVNIGAEWDYQTQILTIGTDCFNAAFSSQCSGDSIIGFTNESTGHFTSSLWNFGDAASGTNDTSTSKNPVHTFSAPGNFTVTLITSDGSNTDTSVQSIYVSSNCIGAQFYNLFGGDCVQNPTTVNTSVMGNITSFHWDFGDTASGAANISNDTIGVHQYSIPGIYLVTLIISDGTQTDTFYNVQNIIDCNVWPGNTNTDGEVNMEDLFAIGIYYHDTGSVRSNASNVWNGQTSQLWGQPGINMMYLQELVDKKHADCNGNGIIDSTDIAAIDLNYGRVLQNYHHNDLIHMMPAAASDHIVQVITPSSWLSSSNVSLPIDLSALDSTKRVYGIALRIYYDGFAIAHGSLSIDYTHGWLGTAGTNLIGIVKDSPANNYIDLGIVRTDKVGISGNGTIAYLNFTVNQYSGIMNFRIDPVVRFISIGIGNQEVFLPVQPVNTQMNIINSVNEINENNISVYPNPVQDLLNIQSINNTNILGYSLNDLSGRLIKTDDLNSGVKKHSIDCNGIASGFYLLTVKTSAGIINTRLQIQ